MKDLRLVLALLMITAAVGVIFFALTYDSAGSGSASWNASSAGPKSLDGPEIPAGTPLAAKCSRPGVINCFGFDSDKALHYTWPAAGVCDEAFRGRKKQDFGRDRKGPGNTVAVVQNGHCVFPEIDRTT